MSLRNILAALVAAASLDAAAGEYTDLWWNPQESGWGANIVQQGETAFDPSKVSNASVGQMIVEPAADGAIVPAFGANYHASIRLRQAVPGQAPWGTRQYEADVLLHIDEGQVFLRVDEAQGRCNCRGPLVQEGKFGRVAGQYECEGGGTGTFQLTDFEVTRHGFSGYLRTFSPANNQYGRVAAARY